MSICYQLQSDIVTHFADKEGNVSDNDKFDVVYDACTASGAGEDYKDKVDIAVFTYQSNNDNLVKSIALLKSDGQYVAINGSPTMWLR